MLLAFSGLYLLIFLLGFLPKPIGIVFALIRGWLMTPLIMEPLLFIMGLFAILILNDYRRRKVGPELVYLEAVEGPEATRLPAGSRSVTFTEEPAKPSGDEMLAAIEGALDMNDDDLAARLLFELSPEELESREVLQQRLRLAHLRSDPNQVRGVLAKLRELDKQKN